MLLKALWEKSVSCCWFKLVGPFLAANEFVTDFKAFVGDSGYSVNQVFICDKTGLYCTLLPQRYLRSLLMGTRLKKNGTPMHVQILPGIKNPFGFNWQNQRPHYLQNVCKDHLPVMQANQMHG